MHQQSNHRCNITYLYFWWLYPSTAISCHFQPAETLFTIWYPSFFCGYHFSFFSLRETYPFVLDENSKKIQERSIIPSIFPFHMSFWRFLERKYREICRYIPILSRIRLYMSCLTTLRWNNTWNMYLRNFEKTWKEPVFTIRLFFVLDLSAFENRRWGNRNRWENSFLSFVTEKIIQVFIIKK